MFAVVNTRGDIPSVSTFFTEEGAKASFNYAIEQIDCDLKDETPYNGENLTYAWRVQKGETFRRYERVALRNGKVISVFKSFTLSIVKC